MPISSGSPCNTGVKRVLGESVHASPFKTVLQDGFSQNDLRELLKRVHKIVLVLRERVLSDSS